MGIFSDVKAIKDVQKLMKGESVNLSLSQIVSLIINLPSAYKRLDKQEYREVMHLYDEYRKCKTKIHMETKEDYYITCVDIIKEFNKIAPWSSYSGLSLMESSILMRKIKEMDIVRQESQDVFSEEEQVAIKEMVLLASNSGLKVDEEDAKGLIKVIRVYNKNGKEEALDEFEKLKKKIKEKYGILQSVLTVPFLIGALSSYGIISKEESKEMSLNYSKEIMKDHNESKALNVEVEFWDKIIKKLIEKGMPAVASALTGTQGHILNDSTFGISGLDAFKKMIIGKPENMEAIKELVAIECEKEMKIEFMD